MCLFCKIVSREIPAKIVKENEFALAFHDVKPIAPTHVLVIPKVHVDGASAMTDATLFGNVMLFANEVAKDLGLHETGYRLVINNGEHGGQTVFHLHVHILGGRHFGWPPG